MTTDAAQMTIRRARARRLAAAAATGLAAVALAACGGGDDGEGSSDDGGPSEAQVQAAAEPQETTFPKPEGRSLQQLADEEAVGNRTNFAGATQTYTPGDNRVAFGVIGAEGDFIYGQSAVYIARSPLAPARGPYLAPADSLVTEKVFRSQNAALEEDPIASIYHAEVPMERSGRFAILVLTEVNGQLFGSPEEITVQEDDPIPSVGDKAPVTETDTLEDAGNQVELIDTRVPPSDLHQESFADVVGEKPVALLFATPQLCQSRVCGPVADIAVQLDAEYGDQMEFIHQEVWVENDPTKGVRQPLQDFNLQTEPWLFTVDADGVIQARLEGSFGVGEFEEAVQAAL